jgi:hypothetical protein
MNILASLREIKKLNRDMQYKRATQEKLNRIPEAGNKTR